MKILFLVFHGFDAFNGISKKIGYQIEALRILGHQVELGSLAVDERGRWKRMAATGSWRISAQESSGS